MSDIVKEAMDKAAKSMALHADRAALGLRQLWYVRSTGEVIGPNWGKLDGKHNKKRNAVGNLFESERDAQRAAKFIRLALRVSRWRIWQ